MKIINKISIISSLNSPHSAYANRLIASVNGLIENGVKVQVLLLQSSQEVENSFAHAGIPFVNLSGKQGNKYLRLMLALFRLIPYLRSKNGFLIHIAKPIVLIWCFLFASRKTIFFHERTEYPNVHKENKFLYVYEYLCKRFNCIFVISHAIKKYFIQQGIDEKKLYIYPMLIDPQRFEICNQSTEVELYIAYCGDMGGNKDGLWNLIEAYTLFHIKIPNVKLYLIGDTKDVEQYNALQNKVKSLNLEKDVVFTGRINREEMPYYLCQAAVLVLARPNNYQAKGGFPTKLGEYLATGKPVVITRTGEIDSYLEDNKDCFFVEPDNPKAFADRLCDVFRDYDFALKVGQEGKKKVYHEFNYKVQTTKLIEFLEQIV